MRSTNEPSIHQQGAMLVVEDEPLLRTVATQILIDAGYVIFEACEAADALTILEGRNDIRAVFTDIELPNMTGLALARTIHERWPDIALLVTSGRIHPTPGALPRGAAFIGKPYDAVELVDMLTRLMAKGDPTSG